MKALILSLILLATTSAHAAVLGSCKGLDSIASMVEVPREFDHGVMIAQVSNDYESGGSVLLVFAYGDDDYVECNAIVASAPHKGFSGLDVKKIKVLAKTTDSELLSVEATVYDEKLQTEKKQIIKIKVQSKFPAATITLK